MGGESSPRWNETVVFDVRDPALTVGVSVHHDRSRNDHNTLRPYKFISRGRISGVSVTRSLDEAVAQRFPLNKRALFSRVADTRVVQGHAAAPAMDRADGQQQPHAPPHGSAVPTAGANGGPAVAPRPGQAPAPGLQYGLAKTETPAAWRRRRSRL